MLYKLSNGNTDADLKKTVAVLLENLLDRVHVLEEKVDRLTRANHSSVGSYNAIQPPARVLASSTAAEGKSVNARGVFSSDVDLVGYWLLFLCLIIRRESFTVFRCCLLLLQRVSTCTSFC